MRPLLRGPATCFNMAQGYSVRSRPESFPRYLYPMAPCSWHTYLDSGCWTSAVEEGTVTTFSACDGFAVCFWWMRIYFRCTDAMQDSSWNLMISNKLAACNDLRTVVLPNFRALCWDGQAPRSNLGYREYSFKAQAVHGQIQNVW